VFWEIYDVEDNPPSLCIFITPFSSNANNFALEKSSSLNNHHLSNDFALPCKFVTMD
jgi:hypothetical protein